jgi:hypothetical protein
METPMTDDELSRDAVRILNRYSVAMPAPRDDLKVMRQLLEPLIFDGDDCRDDVAELCHKIDELLADPQR